MERRGRRFWAQAFSGTLYVLAAIGRASAQEVDVPSPEIVVDITTVPEADERLYLLRALEEMYDVLPVGGDFANFVANAPLLRERALLLQRRADDAQLDGELSRLFADYVSLLDAYSQFLGALDRIESDGRLQSGVGLFVAGFGASMDAVDTYDQALARGASEDQATGAGLLVGGLNLLIDSWQSGQEGDAVRQQAIAAESQRLSDTITYCLAGAQGAAGNLAARYGWARSEAGFTGETDRGYRIARAWQSGDLNGVLAVVEEEIAERPRDPFCRLHRNVYRSWDLLASKEALFAAADDSTAAARLIPAATEYDGDRAEAVRVAAELASMARFREIMLGIEPAGSTPTSRFCVALYRRSLELQPADSTGELRERLAGALLSNGELDEALSTVVQIWNLRQASPSLLYVTACIDSRRDMADSSLGYLQQAIALGLSDVRHARIDPDLAYLRESKPSEFAALTSVNWQWNIVYGVFNDDITLTNNSPFPLTNVTLDLTLKQDGMTWTPDLQAASIAPGQTYTWTSVVSIPGSRLTSYSANLICSQSE